MLDTIQTQFDRFRSREDLVRVPALASGSTRCSTSTRPRRAPRSCRTPLRRLLRSTSFPDNVQWALYPEGAFIGVDMGVLELGIVRDSTLNSTNDFQVFGERFRNVARSRQHRPRTGSRPTSARNGSSRPRVRPGRVTDDD